MLNLLISGINGKTGQVLQKLAYNYGFLIVGGIDKYIPPLTPCPLFNKKINGYYVYDNVKKINVIPNVIIDFSSDGLVKEILPLAKKLNIAVVIGTTNLTKQTKNLIANYSKYIPICLNYPAYQPTTNLPLQEIAIKSLTFAKKLVTAPNGLYYFNSL